MRHPQGPQPQVLAWANQEQLGQSHTVKCVTQSYLWHTLCVHRCSGLLHARKQLKKAALHQPPHTKLVAGALS
jgi:hypothetical protein